MNLFNWIEERPRATNKRLAPTMDGTTPYYGTPSAREYASDIIRIALSRVCDEATKLQPRHVRLNKDGQQEIVAGSEIARVLRKPNKFMSCGDFLSKCWALREITKNCFIYPMYNREGALCGLYPLRPQTVEFYADGYIKLTFSNGTELCCRYSELIHWRKDYHADDFMGGREHSDAELMGWIETYNEVMDSIAKAAKCQLNIAGVMQYGIPTERENLKKERDKFENDLREGNSSVLFMDSKATFTPINRDAVKMIDKETMQFLFEVILFNTGVSLPIIKGDYTPAQKEAFYETALKSGVITLGQALDNVLLNDEQLEAGEQILLYTNRLQFMSIDGICKYLQIVVPVGGVTINEARSAVGLPPIAGGEKRTQSLNYIDSAKANKYQVGEDDEKEESEDAETESAEK